MMAVMLLMRWMMRLRTDETLCVVIIVTKPSGVLLFVLLWVGCRLNFNCLETFVVGLALGILLFLKTKCSAKKTMLGGVVLLVLIWTG